MQKHSEVEKTKTLLTRCLIKMNINVKECAKCELILRPFIKAGNIRVVDKGASLTRGRILISELNGLKLV